MEPPKQESCRRGGKKQKQKVNNQPILLPLQVESSLFRGVLRTTMTVLGGALGYLVMLNGELANNPYWAVAWLAAFSALAGLLAPDRTLR